MDDDTLLSATHAALLAEGPQREVSVLHRHTWSYNPTTTKISEYSRIQTHVLRVRIDMEQITLRLPADELEAIEDEADEHDESRSEYLRDVIESRHEHGEDVDELLDKITTLEAERDGLADELEEKKIEIGRLGGKLETIDDRLDDKDRQIESLEDRIESLEARNKELTNMASAANRLRAESVELERRENRSVFGRIRNGIFGGSDANDDE